MGSSRCVAVVGAILMVIGTVSCSGSSAAKASAPPLKQVLPAYGQVDTSLAKITYQRALKKDPGDKYALYNLGVIAKGSGDTKTAQTDFLKAIAIDPKFEAPLFEEGLLRFHARDIKGAISYLGRAVTANRQDACAHWVLGLALSREIGPPNNHRAANELRAALKLYPALLKDLASPKVKPNEVPGCN